MWGISRRIRGLLIAVMFAIAGCGSESQSQQATSQPNQVIQNQFNGSWTANYQYPVNTGSSGATLSIGGNPPDNSQVQYDTGLASLIISGSDVTFVPVSGASVTGTISNSGAITVPDRTINCKDISGNDLTLPTKLTLNSDGTVNGEWAIGLPLPNVGYCFAYPVSAVMHADILNPRPILILKQ